MAQVSYPQLNWRAAGTTSDPIEMAGQTVVGFFLPAVFTGATATFETSDAINGTYVPIRNSGGSSITFTVSANGYCGFTNDQIMAFMGVRFLRMVSASSEAAGRQVKLACRELQ